MINVKGSPAPLLAVRAVIRDKSGNILILKRASSCNYGDLWNLPGGKVDYGQRAEEAVKREILEETSLNIESTQFLFYMDGLPEEPGDEHYLTLIFSCVVKGSIELNDESSRYSWVGRGDIHRYKFAFDSDLIIKACLEK